MDEDLDAIVVAEAQAETVRPLGGVASHGAGEIPRGKACRVVVVAGQILLLTVGLALVWTEVVQVAVLWLRVVLKRERSDEHRG